MEEKLSQARWLSRLSYDICALRAATGGECVCPEYAPKRRGGAIRSTDLGGGQLPNTALACESRDP